MGDWARLPGELVPRSGAVRYDEPLSRHTTFRIGGPARALVTVETPDELKALLAFAREQKVPWKLIGAGSNLLVSDQGFSGMVLQLGKGFATVSCDGAMLVSGGATRLSELLTQAEAGGLGGLEFLWGIPGSFGGSVRNNAGAFGHDLGELVVSLDVLSPDGRAETLARSDLKFGYRRSSLPEGMIVTAGRLKLKPAAREEIARRVAECREQRRAAQPRGASAGCIFKNPKNDAAGRMIDKAGLKGRKVGDAVVSEQHANFIINQGKARFADVYQLMQVIKLKVEEKFGVVLEEEVEIVADR